jgi:hypothetical protein
MFFREVFLPRTEVAIGFWYLAFTRARPVARDSELAHLEFRVRNRTTRDARVGRPVESAVEYVLAPAVLVILVDVVDTAVLDHDFVGRGCEWRNMAGTNGFVRMLRPSMVTKRKCTSTYDVHHGVP